MIRSGLVSRMALTTSSKLVTSPYMTFNRSPIPDSWSEWGLMSMQTTSSPLSISRRIALGPIKPVPPITRIAMSSSCGKGVSFC